MDHNFGRAFAKAIVAAFINSRAEGRAFNVRMVASLDRKRLGTKISRQTSWTRGVFDKEASRKPLAFAADAVSYGI